MSNLTNAQTTIANGDWSNPATWGGTPPIMSGNVVINHKVILDMDYTHTSGSITINSTGSLEGITSMRGLALNYPNGTASLTVNGGFNVARTSLISGTVINNGSITADSLLNAALFTNAAGSSIVATEFMNNFSGDFKNLGNIKATNFLNAATFTNEAAITSNDLMNSKFFFNETSGSMTINNDFSNNESVTSPAIFTNDGSVSVGHDWENAKQMLGSGKFCVANNSWNHGVMSGTLDFCDQTGGNVDLNTGTIATTITYCLNSCNLGSDEIAHKNKISVFPNPFSKETTFQSENAFQNATLVIYNSSGQIVREIKNISGQTVVISRDKLASGLYFYHLVDENNSIHSDKLLILD